MKVVVAHNRYRSTAPSGENAVVDAEIAELRDAGIDVVRAVRSSDDLSLRSPAGIAAATLGPVYAPRGVPAFRRLLETERPDVVHVHNVYPLLSPWIVRTAHELGLPVVQTIHNFRHDCVAGTYFRDGRICTDCSGTRFAHPAVRHGCYRDSSLQSAPMAVGRTVHRATWLSVDRFLALTPFHADFLRSLGAKNEQIVVRPTSSPDPGPVIDPPSDDVVFVGRLEVQKGVRVLLDAWSRSTARVRGGRLHLVGDGPLRREVAAAAANDSTIVAHGLLEPDDVSDKIVASGLVVLPSLWFEGLPRVLVEAIARGRAVAVSDFGGLAGALPDEACWRFTPTADGIVYVLDMMTSNHLRAKGRAARAAYESTYAPAVTLPRLLAVYREVANLS